MEFRNTFEALQTNANEIANLLSLLKKQEGPRRIDVDLILDKLRSMYDLMLDIQSTIGNQNYEPVKGQMKSVLPEEPTETILRNETFKQEPLIIETEAEAVKVVPVIPADTKKTESEIFRIIEENNPEKTQEERLKERKQTARANIEQDLKKEKDVNEAGSKKTFVSDRFKTSKPTLGEDLASKKKFDDLGTQLKSQGMSGINTSLGLNEKFEIINELFDGSKEKFEYTLQVLNMAGSFVEAYNYLKENFNWNMDDSHVQRLLEPIRRKLIVQRNDE